MICSSYRTLHFEILKLKKNFRSDGYPKNSVDNCTKMYLDKVFMKHPNICIVPKKELVCVFRFLNKKSLEIKKRLQNAISVLSVIAATLYITAKQNAIFTSEQLNIWEFRNQLFQITCQLVTAT